MKLFIISLLFSTAFSLKLYDICVTSDTDRYHTIGVPKTVLKWHLDKGDLYGNCDQHFEKSCWNC